MNLEGVFSFAREIIEGGTLEKKLVPPPRFDLPPVISDYTGPKKWVSMPLFPHREGKIERSEHKEKFPRLKKTWEKEKVAKALHFFANHELLAVEMMAQGLLLFSQDEKGQVDYSFVKKTLKTLKDEQRHFQLYRKRIQELGSDFGDFGLGGHFWDHFKTIKTKAHFYSLVSLTFEQANLDFALYYRDLFKNLGDDKSSNLMNRILRDEIGHVHSGGEGLQSLAFNTTLWDFYQNSLLPPLSPARAKGMIFNEKGRVQAGLPQNFIQKIKAYRDPFPATDRKEWKKK